MKIIHKNYRPYVLLDSTSWENMQHHNWFGLFAHTHSRLDNPTGGDIIKHVFYKRNSKISEWLPHVHTSAWNQIHRAII
jgi:hypothetical protein